MKIACESVFTKHQVLYWYTNNEKLDRFISTNANGDLQWLESAILFFHIQPFNNPWVYNARIHTDEYIYAGDKTISIFLYLLTPRAIIPTMENGHRLRRRFRKPEKWIICVSIRFIPQPDYHPSLTLTPSLSTFYFTSL